MVHFTVKTTYGRRLIGIEGQQADRAVWSSQTSLLLRPYRQEQTVSTTLLLGADLSANKHGTGFRQVWA